MGIKKEAHPDFVEYTQFIASHEAYKGMPDLYTDKGTIQWEAPSNRQSGKYKDTYQRRLEWWRKKALEVGIGYDSSMWISKTAKMIHPTKQKPCKKCGRVMEIQYVYPNAILAKRIFKLSYVGNDFKIDGFERITILIDKLIKRYGERVFSDLPAILSTSSIRPPSLGSDLNRWIAWIEKEYILLEPSTLSPGVMSNAPDRFDGFHSFNLCCRSDADTGRHKPNMSTYSTDRRVFEYWNEGDWIAADRLVGLIKSRLRDERCFYDHPGPCNADHIGPLSLGFAHRPEFQFLCGPCNSAKNNRMTFKDVTHLKEVEGYGGVVTSWYNKDIWDLRKKDVVDDETALRLSKLLRDNRHTAMSILEQLIANKFYIFLSTFLSLTSADYDVAFTNLSVINHMTHYDDVVHTSRTTKYSLEQKARRMRVAYKSLLEYSDKDNRNAFVILNKVIKDELNTVFSLLKESPLPIRELDQHIDTLLASSDDETVDMNLRLIVGEIPSDEPDNFIQAMVHINKIMKLVAEQLSNMWTDDRYIRADSST